MTESNGNARSEAVKLRDFDCYVWLENGRLIGCEADTYEPAGDDTYAYDVTDPLAMGPENAERFLQAVNAALGTSYRVEDFSG